MLTPSNLRSSSKKMRYSREGKKLYTDTPATQNAYNFACLQNMGTLQLFLNKCTKHTKTCGGTFVFKGDCTGHSPHFFMELVFAVFSFNAVFVLQILFLKVIISSKSHSYRKEAVAFLVFRNWHLWQVLT